MTKTFRIWESESDRKQAVELVEQARADERAKMQIQYREEIRTFRELCEKRLGRLLMDIVEHAQELVNRTFENEAELKEIK